MHRSITEQRCCGREFSIEEVSLIQEVVDRVHGESNISIDVALVVDETATTGLQTALVPPARLGEFVFARHWLAVEIASLLLLIAMVGAFFIGKTSRPTNRPGREEEL